VKVLLINKEEYTATIDLSEDNPNDWKLLMLEEEKTAKTVKSRKKKK